MSHPKVYLTFVISHPRSRNTSTHSRQTHLGLEGKIKQRFSENFIVE